MRNEMSNSNILVVLAGGSGVRFHSDKPKQYTIINGKEQLVTPEQTLLQIEMLETGVSGLK